MTKSKRNNQKLIWADMDFAKELEVMKAELLIAGKPLNNLGQLTKEILRTKSFKQIRLELLNKLKKEKIRVNIDRGRY